MTLIWKFGVSKAIADAVWIEVGWRRSIFQIEREISDFRFQIEVGSTASTSVIRRTEMKNKKIFVKITD